MALVHSSAPVLSNIKPDKALEDAVASFRKVLTKEQNLELDQIKSVPDTDAVLVFTAKLDAQRRSAKGRSISSRLCSILQSVRDFSSVVDTYVAANPDIAALVWGSVKMTMLQEFKPDLDEITRYCDIVQHELELATAQAAYQDQELQKVERSEAASARRGLSRFIRRNETEFDRLNEWRLERDKRQERERRRQLLDTLSTHDHLTPLKLHRRKRSSRTAQWVFEASEFQRWNSEIDCSALWCNGKIGSGKTILTTSVIDHILANKSPVDVVAFFFLQFDAPDSCRVETILRSLTRQVLESMDPTPEMLDILEAILSTSPFDDQTFFNLTRAIPQLQRKLYIFVDGLDECDQEDSDDLIKALSGIPGRLLSIKLFLTSRNKVASTAEPFFTNLEQISTDSELSHADIPAFIEDELTSLLQSERLVVGDSNLLGEITRLLSAHADGMFLWVKLVLGEVCSQRCDDDIRKAIRPESLPKGMTEVFVRTLKRIMSQKNEDIVQKILPWITAAHRPLNLDELEESCFIEPLQASSIPSRRLNGVHLVDSWFEGLVEVDEENKTIHFIHTSVRSFVIGKPSRHELIRFHVDAESASQHIGQICVTYLHFTDFHTTLARRMQPIRPIIPMDIAQTALSGRWSSLSTIKTSRLWSNDKKAPAAGDVDGTIVKLLPGRIKINKKKPDHPFLDYAAAEWVLHTNEILATSKTWSMWRNMVLTGHPLALCPVSHRPLQPMNIEIVRWAFDMRHHSLMRIAASTDFPEKEYVHLRLIKAAEDEDPELLNLAWDMGDPTLWMRIGNRAAEGGNILLVEKVISICEGEDKGAAHHNALLCAAGYGRLDLIKYLLRRGNELYTVLRMRAERTMALRKAARYGHVEAAQLFLAGGADIGLYAGEYSNERTALEEAVGNRRNGVLKLFLDPSVISTASPESFKDALHLAAKNKAYEVIKDLCNAFYKIDGDFEGSDIPYSRLLIEAAKCGHPQVMRFLLSEGVDQIDCYFALAAAAGSGVLECVQILIDAVVVVRPTVTSEGQRALEAAAERGHSGIVELLLKHEVSPNQVSRGATKPALQLAIEGDHASVVSALLTAGANAQVFPSNDLNVSEGWPLKPTPIQVAMRRGNPFVIESLVSAGAEANYFIPVISRRRPFGTFGS